MDSGEIPDHYYTYEGRLASFRSHQPVTRRPSNAKGRGPKALSWPHKQLNPEEFARAGFIFEPTPENQDNTVCFLCHKNVGGWEENDNPFEEHLRLSPHCGWAIVAGIEAGLGDYGMDDPTSSHMIEARKATFAGRWPHEGKRGWKCKTKQLVDAGWKYTPTMDGEDMATCAYCQLALDGWEPKDNPMDEHYRRSPDCQFFILINQYKSAPAKKKGRGKGARTSKASRVSSQSIATAASDATSLLDQSVDQEDSIMTTASVATQGGTKRGRAKKATGTKGKKTKAKQDEPIEVLEDAPAAEADLPPPPPPKSTRGRKRKSDDAEDSVLTTASAPAPKKRATRGRNSKAVDTSVLEHQLDPETTEAEPAPLPKTRGRKGRSTNSRTSRKASAASTASAASVREEESHILDDDELDRQLQADMDRPLSDEDIAADSDSERRKLSAGSMTKEQSTKRSTSSRKEEPSSDHAMLDSAPPQIDEAEIDAELQALETEMETETNEAPQPPKKGRKAGTRKASKPTTKKTKGKAPAEPMPETKPEPTVEDETVDELAEGHEMSIASNATVVRTSLASTTSAPKKRGRPSKKDVAAKRASKLAEGMDVSSSQHANTVEPPSEPAALTQKKPSPDLSEPAPTGGDENSPPAAASENLEPPATPPKAVISPAPAAKQAVVSPSQSPQSSDAENQPPSSKPSKSADSSRVALAPVAVTPVRSSPTRRNVFAGLQSERAWTAADLDLVFEELGKENAAAVAGLLRSGGGLATPEKQMTVEEWIYYNAGQAERKLKHECEAIVTAFEKEGTRAMQTLEGLMVD
ncbi:hypothetical protein GGR56DRAFT_46819 [Xylariaceae sp. FL0804]|nr:hypothetical protein GGR56DRAFT_46819 [Xylariaceae sp. FL0804]